MSNFSEYLVGANLAVITPIAVVTYASDVITHWGLDGKKLNYKDM